MSVPRPRSPLGAVALLRGLALGFGVAAATALLAFHARLLWLRVSAGSILDAPVAARWVSSAVLLGALLMLRRRPLALPNGRSALAFWLLVAVLHWNAAAREPLADVSEPRGAVQTLVLLPAGAGLAFAAGLAMFASRRRQVAQTLAVRLEVRPRHTSGERPGWRRIRAARPPPLLTGDGITSVA